MLTLILGGARSGKSSLAQRIAAAAMRVTYIATARRGGDPEMWLRVERHRASRPSSWRTVEEPLSLGSGAKQAAKDSDVVLIDCLTVWLSNLFFEYREASQEQVEAAARAELAEVADAARACHIIVVSNELGSGTVPEPALTRRFRDTQGLLNQWAAEMADEVMLTVAGLPLYLKTTAGSQ